MDIRPLATKGFDFWSPTVTAPSGVDFGKGSIQLEQGWQLCAIPVVYGYWDVVEHKLVHDEITTAKFKNYVLDQIEDLYGADIVEVANTYTGDNQFFYSYVVGSTPESSPHNFQLTYADGSNLEISGFWIKIIGDSGPYIINWGE